MTNIWKLIHLIPIHLHSASKPSQHMYDVVVKESVAILQCLTAAHQSTRMELPLQLPACRFTTYRSNDCLGGHSTDQHFHIRCVVNILDNKLVEGLVFECQ